MTALAFAAGWLVGATCLAVFIGLVVRMADALEPTPVQPDAEPVYVPSEWVL